MSINLIRIPDIYYGYGSLKELRTFKQERILIVSDKTVWELFGIKILKYFKKRETKIFDEIEPDPKDITIQKGGDIARGFKPDLIVGIGGGSVMDAAKVIYFLYEREDKTILDINPLQFFKLGLKSKLVLIPTTSGSGAEMTPAAVVTKTETGQKLALPSFELVASAVIIDPRLPSGMPPKLTASTGMDALTHAIEGKTNNKMNNDFTDAVNLHAIRLLFKYLPAAVGEGAEDKEIREKIHNAASLGGIGLYSSSGIAHSCGHALGGVHHIQHGISVGVMLPYVLEFNKPECEEKYIEILKALNVTDIGDPTTTLVKMIKELLKKVNLPTTLKELIPANEWNQNLDKLVEFAKTDLMAPFNPRATLEEDFRKIFQYAYEGKNVDW